MTDRETEFFEKVGQSRAVNSYATSMPTPVEVAIDSGSHKVPAFSARRWAANDGVFYGANETYDAMPCGLYRCGMSPNVGPFLTKQNIETDNLLELPDDSSTRIIVEFGMFWKIGDKFRERGFLQKRGFLLWGPPGSGKTSCVHILIKRLIEDHDGIVLIIDEPGIASACLRMVRHVEPKRPIVAIMEDIDALIDRHGENLYLALLDGEAQVDNIVFVATTNYPERLDARFVDRPSRFDTIRYVGMPSSAARRVYLSAKEPSLKGDELEHWVSLSKGFSIAHLKELIIAVRCFDQPVDEVAARLAKMHSRRPTSEDAPGKNGVGFIGLNGHHEEHPY